MQIQRLLSENTESTPLYRGISTDEDLSLGMTVGNRVRKDRRPLNSHPFGAAMFDYGIEMLHGIKGVRRQALFSSSNPITASSYGDYTVRLDLEPSDKVLFNPEISDSMVNIANGTQIMEAAFRSLIGIVREDVLSMRYRPYSREWYNDPESIPVKFEKAMRTYLSDWFDGPELDEQVSRFQHTFIESCKYAADGYVATTYSQLSVTGDVEVMVYDISEFSGTVINPRNPNADR